MSPKISSAFLPSLLLLLLSLLSTTVYTDDIDNAEAVNLKAVGLTIQGPTEIPSGWTTFNFENSSNMIHLVMVDVPPEGVDVYRMETELVVPFQNYLDALNAQDPALAADVLTTFPAWQPELSFMGGPGLTSGQRTSTSTVYLEPGLYVLECYVISNGIWHTYNPAPDALGMVLQIRVTDEKSENVEPEADMTLSVSNAGIEIVNGKVKAGFNRFKVNFLEQQTHPNFLQNDVHIVRVEKESDLAAAVKWLDWRDLEGFRTPAPVQFYGGLNEMPAGTTGYFGAYLDPGEYAFIGEVPNADSTGFLVRFFVR